MAEMFEGSRSRPTRSIRRRRETPMTDERPWTRGDFMRDLGKVSQRIGTASKPTKKKR